MTDRTALHGLDDSISNTENGAVAETCGDSGAAIDSSELRVFGKSSQFEGFLDDRSKVFVFSDMYDLWIGKQAIKEAENQKLIARAEELMLLNAKQAQSKNIYEEEYKSVCDQISENKRVLDMIEKQIVANLTRKKEIKLFLDSLKVCPPEISKFDVQQWHNLVESVKVMPNKTLVFRFRNGQEVSVKSDETQ